MPATMRARRWTTSDSAPLFICAFAPLLNHAHARRDLEISKLARARVLGDEHMLLASLRGDERPDTLATPAVTSRMRQWMSTACLPGSGALVYHGARVTHGSNRGTYTAGASILVS